MRILVIFAFSYQMQAQTALNSVPVYTGDFGQGMNFGWFDNWEDEDLGRLAAGTPDGLVPGIGVNTIRPGLFSWFLEEFGYDIREDAFDTYAQLGLKDNVVIIGFPSNAQRSDEQWCSTGQRSELFKGMWEPIWDDNFGTPWNEDNLYADYLYKAVEQYGNGVKFWEVWNEPDINYSGNGWKDRSFDGNWFDNDPDACELAIQAPVQAYVRMLRITYEVVKRLQPNDYVAVGGLGFSSFLDVILRKTDEKSSGAVTAQHPLTGGAYFDAMSFHIYPHVDGSFREWDNDAGDWAYLRTSDAGVKGVENKYLEMDVVLNDYGFNGTTYPEKVWLCTEANLPRRGFDDPSAAKSTEEMQRNFMIKVLAKAQEWGLSQFHPYQLADSEIAADASFEFHTMGFYRYIDNLTSLDQPQVTEAGIGYRTYGELLRGAKYSAALTADLALPSGAMGVGFTLPTGTSAYLIWAETTEDGNENLSVPYTLSGDLMMGNHLAANWDYSITGSTRPAVGTLQLSGAPVFLVHSSEINGGTNSTEESVVEDAIELWPNPVSDRLVLKLPESKQAWRVDVLDMLGRYIVLQELPSSSQGGMREISVGKLKRGTYVLRATMGEKVLISPFVKQ